MAHVADSAGPAVLKNKPRADSQKRRSPVPFRIASRARKRESWGGVGANAGAFLPERGFAMRNRIDIDPKHSRAIVQEIGRDYARSCKKSRNCRGALADHKKSV